MSDEFDEYTFLIGKITIASAHLEEVVLRWTALFSDGDMQETYKQNLFAGLESNLNLLKTRVGKRCSKQSLDQLVPLVEKAREIKNRRNENVHGVWYKMFDAHTGIFAKVQRTRQALTKDTKVKRDGQLIWKLDTPSIEELKSLSSDLDSIANSLNEFLSNLWDMDEPVVRWRDANDFL